MWEPFTERARRTIVRAQEVAQMFASNFIGVEHIAFALAEGDDEVGRIVSTAIDRDELRERLGTASSSPNPEMVFTAPAKRAIELAFENARRLDHNFIGGSHLALGVFQSDGSLPLREGVDLQAVFAELSQAAGVDALSNAIAWEQTSGPGEPHAAGAALLNALRHHPDLAPPGTEVSITIARPGAEPQTWTWKTPGGEPQR